MQTGFRLNGFTIRPRRDCIESAEETVHVKPKAMAVLVRLAESAGHVVTREELFESVWPGAVVSDAVLTQCVLELRKAFRDSARNPEIIETVPKVGFRLLPEVQPLVEASVPARRWTPVAWAFALLALVVIGVLSWPPPDPERNDPAAPASGVRTLAVLPFTDVSEAGNQQWLADGLAQELRVGLARLDGLRVIGRRPADFYDGTGAAAHELADKLGVEFLLEGSVHRDRDRLQVTAQLIGGDDGFQVWAEQFERSADDLFAVEREIVESVAVALSIELDVGELGTNPSGPSSVEAFELATRAWHERLLDATSESTLEGIGMLRRAVDIDPGYARAWVQLAHFYKLAPMVVDPRLEVDWYALAEDALDRAEELAPAYPLTQSMRLQHYAHEHRWLDGQDVVTEYGTAFSDNADFLFSTGVFLVHVGRVREATAKLELSRMLDPKSVHHVQVLGHACLFQGRIAEALEHFETAFGFEQTSRRLASLGGLEAALAADDPEQIERWLARVLKYADEFELAFFEPLADHWGDPERARAVLRQAFDEGSQLTDYHLTLLAAYFGDLELAAAAMARTPDSWALWSPLVADLRSGPAFDAAVRELALPEYWRAYGWADRCRSLGPMSFECR